MKELPVIQPSGIGEPNTKLGRLIHAWSILAGLTCPGESLLCKCRCYALHGNFLWNTTKTAHGKNTQFSRTELFADWMVHEIQRRFVRVLRVHVAGDFYDEIYIDKWVQIAKALPDVTMYAYTRSWRLDELFPALLRLARLPNFHMWWSIDRETGPAPSVPGVRVAYMAIDDVDARLVPDDTDLLFRVRPKTPMQSANGVHVCPVETKIPGEEKKHTCSSCGLCWNGKVQPKWQKELLPECQEILSP